MRNETEKIVLAGLFIAIGSILPSLFHAAGLGKIVSPMHFPVLIAGIVLGWKYGLGVGIVTPIITSLMFTMPPLVPIAYGMSFELAAYGAVIGLVYKYLKIFKTDIYNVFFALIIAMILGRIVYGMYYFILYAIQTEPYGFSAFFASTVLGSIPGIILQILIIPALINIIFLKRNFNN